MDLPRVPRLLDRSGVGLLPVVAGGAAAVAVTAQAFLPRESVAALAVYLVTAAAATAVAGAAARRHRPGEARAWRLVVTAMAISVALILIQLAGVLAGARIADTDIVGAAYLLPYLILAIGLFELVRIQRSRFDRAALLDAAIIVLGVGVGAFLFATTVTAPAAVVTGQLQATVAATFGLGLPSLTIVMWLAMTGGPSRVAAALLLAAVAAQSAGDSMYGLELANPAIALPRESAWLASLVLLSVAAVASTRSRDGPQNEPLIRDPVRTWLLGLAIAAPAVAGLEASITNRSRELVSVLVLAVVGLAIARISYLLRQVSRLAADTRAHKRLIAELDRARREYQTLVDAAPGMAWTSRIVDPQSGATARLFIGPQAEAITGHAAESFMTGGRRWRDVMHPDDRAAASDRYRAWIRGVASAEATDDAAQADEYRIVRNDGSVRWLRDTHHLVRGTAGEASTVHGLVLDITEQRMAEDEVRASEARFRALVEQLPGVVILREVDHGAAGRIVYVSPSSEKLLGWSPDELATNARLWAELIEPADLGAVLEARTRHLTTGLRESVVARVHERPEHPGIARWIELTWARAQALDGRRWLSLGVILDVTDLRQAQEELRAVNADLEDRITHRTAELRAAQLDAERASRAKSEFLSSMSHELRTPLNAILGFGQLLQMAPLAEPDLESADEIVRAGRNLLAMIEAVLEFSRLDAGRISLSIEPVELGPLIRETIDLCRPGADERGISIVDEVAGKPPVVVLADRRRLGQILLNLVSNGVRYNRPDGTVTLSATANGDQARIRVRDTGVGIAAERLPRLFEPFETMRGDHTTPQSLGLGLALSARLAGLMGGALHATSNLGAGSEFELEIPLATGAAADLVGVEAAAEPGLRADGTVLYIEDNLANLHLVERILTSRFRVRVLAAIQGRMGFELAREHLPGLILLDLHLPDVEPGEILRELRADERTRSIPVVILSSDNSSATAREMQQLGATDFLTKPLDVERFLEVVKGLLQEG